jgi:hypothetical protein
MMTWWLTSIAAYPATTSSVAKGKTRVDFMSHILPVGMAGKGHRRPHFESTGKPAGAQPRPKPLRPDPFRTSHSFTKKIT